MTAIDLGARHRTVGGSVVDQVCLNAVLREVFEAGRETATSRTRHLARRLAGTRHEIPPAESREPLASCLEPERNYGSRLRASIRTATALAR